MNESPPSFGNQIETIWSCFSLPICMCIHPNETLRRARVRVNHRSIGAIPYLLCVLSIDIRAFFIQFCVFFELLFSLFCGSNVAVCIRKMTCPRMNLEQNACSDHVKKYFAVHYVVIDNAESGAYVFNGQPNV